MKLTFQQSLIVLALSTGVASAADMPIPRNYSLAPPAASVTQPDLTGWYLRGDVGAQKLTSSGVSQADLQRNGGSFISHSIGSSALVGVGLGYKANSWLRFDITGDYRTSAPVKALDGLEIRSSNLLIGRFNTQYSGSYSAAVGLFNAYFDLGNWYGLTPYVGAGIGVARYQMEGFTDTGFATTFTYGGTAPFPLLSTNSSTTSGYARDKSKFNLAWAVMAGATMDITERVKLDIGYRYTNLGKVTSTALINCICGAIGQPLKMADMASHDLRVGLRWMFGAPVQTAAGSYDDPRPVVQRPMVRKF